MRRLKTVYEMIFPYGFYNNKPGETCVVIDRGLKTLCRNNELHVILMIGRYLDLGFTPNSSISEICAKIQDKIRNICLSEDIHEMDKSQYIIGLKTNITNITENPSVFNIQDRILCNLIPFNKEQPIWSMYISGRNFYFLKDLWEPTGWPTENAKITADLKAVNKYMIINESVYHTVKPFKELWENEDIDFYIFIPELNIAGARYKLREIYGPYIEPYIEDGLTHENYMNTKKDVFEQEMAKEPKVILTKSFIEMFKEDMEGINVNKRIERLVYSEEMDPDVEPFLYKLYDMIINNEIELARVENNNKVIFTTLGDLC